jgi:hypothetical protein
LAVLDEKAIRTKGQASLSLLGQGTCPFLSQLVDFFILSGQFKNRGIVQREVEFIYDIKAACFI